MTAPKRIQRRRVKGWRMPEGAVYVGRGSKWGNPFIAGRTADAAQCVAAYQTGNPRLAWTPPTTDTTTFLRGKNLACWCKLCERHKDGLPLGETCADCAPCHADVLLEIANR
jgi:hypothetical protein